jgi:hypothetical protein
MFRCCSEQQQYCQQHGQRHENRGIRQINVVIPNFEKGKDVDDCKLMNWVWHNRHVAWLLAEMLPPATQSRSAQLKDISQFLIGSE